MAGSAFNRDPIFWTTTQPGYNDDDRLRQSNVRGKVVREKVPQRGHVNDYDEPKVYARGVRYVTVVRHDGHTVSSVLTNGAAHLDASGPYGQYIRMKHRFLGWFGTGECPCALVSARVFSADCIVSDEVRSGNACEPGSYGPKNPCKHAKAEMAARIAIQKESTDERERNHQTKDDKIVEQQGRMIELLAQQVAKPEAAPVPKAPKTEPKKD